MSAPYSALDPEMDRPVLEIFPVRGRGTAAPRRCPGGQPVLPVGGALELIYSSSLSRVAGVIIPMPVTEEILSRCASIGGVREWKSWSDLAKRWGAWAVFGEDRWGVAETVLSGSRPKGWKFRFLD